MSLGASRREMDEKPSTRFFVLTSAQSVQIHLSSILCPLTPSTRFFVLTSARSAQIHLSSIFYLLSSVFYLLSSIFLYIT
ncbi:MAG: hypothetical protein LBD06_04440, partial [Candidatus Accumulibacter sp.]|nr:hypothetical protein [Accumulibacter sp.]